MSEELQIIKSFISDVNDRLTRLSEDTHDEIIWRTNVNNSLKDLTSKIESVLHDLIGNGEPGLKTKVMLQEKHILDLQKDMAKVDALHIRVDKNDKKTDYVEASISTMKKYYWIVITGMVMGIPTLMTIWLK